MRGAVRSDSTARRGARSRRPGRRGGSDLRHRRARHSVRRLPLSPDHRDIAASRPDRDLAIALMWRTLAFTTSRVGGSASPHVSNDLTEIIGNGLPKPEDASFRRLPGTSHRKSHVSHPCANGRLRPYRVRNSRAVARPIRAPGAEGGRLGWVGADGQGPEPSLNVNEAPDLDRPPFCSH
ncbi:MAG: hypothetical protein JWQ36_1816 [Enterovirga sp.]|nr:hypothetical protein [Enterovirga sp.]